MIANLLYCFAAVWRFRGYKPQRVTIRSINRWLYQFDKKDRKALRLLLNQIIYKTENEIEKALVALHQKLLDRLAASGIPPKKVIYVQVHDAGSSSPLILNMLRDAARLQQRGCRFLDSKDVKGLHDATNQLEEGAIIYVDDFSGSGNQFCQSRDFFAQHIVGNFVEFFLLPCICEEAVLEMEARGVEPITALIHFKTERPLHESCNLLSLEIKNRLTNLCFEIDRKGGLGYKRMATMVVIYRNAPNTIPILLRGNPGQHPYCGIFPRTTDLPY
jgi:hypothetical protein